MAEPRFGKSVEALAKQILEPAGFRTVQHEEAGYAPSFSFLRSWREGFAVGIGVYAVPRRRAFVVELGVIREGGSFYRAAPLEMGPWRTEGLRVRLEEVAEARLRELSSFDGDFLLYRDQETLEFALGRTLALALEYGPAAWEGLWRRITGQTEPS